MKDMEPVLKFLVTQLVEKLVKDTQGGAEDEAEAYDNVLRGVFDAAKKHKISPKKLSKAIKAADPDNKEMCRAAAALREEFEA